MAVQWTSDLAVGIIEVDHQHQELFVQINNLLEAMSQGKGADEVGMTLRFLGDYVASHFMSEERLMARLSYPGYSAHKAQHVAFINVFARLKAQFEAQGPSALLVIQVQQEVLNWLRNHIRKTDMLFGDYLGQKKAA